MDRIPGHAERIVREHAAIAKRLAEDDRAALCAEMQRHIDAVARHLTELRGCLPDSYFGD